MDAEEEKRGVDEPMGDAREDEDAAMEDVGALAGAELSLARELSELVFNDLAASLSKVKDGGMKELKINEAVAEREKNIDSQLGDLGIQICAVYRLDYEEFDLAKLAVNHAASRARDHLASPTTVPDVKERARLQEAFKQPYVGDTHLKFHGYLARCWRAYRTTRSGYTSPYVSLVQSSGFGKSRLLRELAEVTREDTVKQPADSVSNISMRVLYVCARSVPKSSGFPVATPSLTKWFFNENHTVEEMTNRLLTTFKYAQRNWGEVGKKWFELFSDLSADESVGEAIAAPSPSIDKKSFHSSSALSSRVVADFMGVLNYVTYTNDSHITSYPSEPVLAFGAAHLWYQLQSTALEKYLLPRFQEMLMQRLVDIGDIGEVVARIFLLLAMDATVMGSREEPMFKQHFIFSGQFCTVRQFLDELGGKSPVLKSFDGDIVTEEQESDYKAWMTEWEKWKVGFSQFEDLPEEPTVEMLWLLLGRRAAGVLRRNQKGADLVIPIFSGDDASFILVQVNNRIKEEKFPGSATTGLLPRNVLNDPNLQKKPARDMIWLCITLREEATEEKPAQTYLVTTRRTSTRQGTNNQEEPAYALCLRGVCKSSPETEANAASRPWSFLTSGLSRCLEQIVNAAWWDMKERVLSDVNRREESAFGKLLSVLSEDDLMEAVECSQPIVLCDGKYGPRGAKRKRRVCAGLADEVASTEFKSGVVP